MPGNETVVPHFIALCTQHGTFIFTNHYTVVVNGVFGCILLCLVSLTGFVYEHVLHCIHVQYMHVLKTNVQ